MEIHEYQGKELFRRYVVPVPKGVVAFTPDEAEAAAARVISETGREVVVVKSQIHAGGRGKGTVTQSGNDNGRGVRLITHSSGGAIHGRRNTRWREPASGAGEPVPWHAQPLCAFYTPRSAAARREPQGNLAERPTAGIRDAVVVRES